MKSEMVACDNPECTSKASVPHAKVHPDGWWYVSGPHPHGRLDFCSIACLSFWSRAAAWGTQQSNNIRSITQ